MSRRLTIELPDVRLEALAWGPSEGPLAVLLHGFPDTAYTWRHLAPELADRGWRVVAPFTRGYAPSGLPRSGSFRVSALMEDAVGVHAELGGGPDAVLVGHDWGAITANGLAADPASPFARIVSLSVPPFAALRTTRLLPILPGQLRRSWYIGLNQVPVLPERLLDSLVPRLWRSWSPGYDASEDLVHVARAFADPAHRTAALTYYRHLPRSLGVLNHRPRVPMLYLHGVDDGCLDVRLADGVGAVLPPGSAVHLVEGAGHFVHLEQPEAVAELVTGFVAP